MDFSVDVNSPLVMSSVQSSGFSATERITVIPVGRYSNVAFSVTPSRETFFVDKTQLVKFPSESVASCVIDRHTSPESGIIASAVYAAGVFPFVVSNVNVCVMIATVAP